MEPRTTYHTQVVLVLNIGAGPQVTMPSTKIPKAIIWQYVMKILSATKPYAITSATM